MAMLAEPRRRQKWTLNPRGKHWSEDSNKFGQKMLEKMGWSSGKGLGANEQGMTEHVRVSLKNDNAGFGFKNDGVDKAWTEHHEGFNDLLKELQSSQETSETVIVETKHETLSGKSLEMKSKQSRARVHYHKFTRGKDVNKYSSKDLANIFGQKDLSTNNTAKEETVEQEEEEYSLDPVGTQDTRGGVLTIKSGSISDYLKNKGSSLYKAPETRKRERQPDSEDEPVYAGFGFSSSQNKDQSNNEGVGACNYGFVNPCLSLDSPKQTNSPVVKVKKSKKRKSASTFYDEEVNDSINKTNEDSVLPNDCTNGFTNPGLNLGNEAGESPNGSEFEVSRAEFGVTNSAFDPEDERGSKKRVTFNDHVEYSTDPVKKKKGKATLDKFEVEIKPQKRKRKHKEISNDSIPVGFVNQALDCEEKSSEVLDNEINERKTTKAKKRRASLLETIVETPEEDKSEIIELDNDESDDDVIEIQQNESTDKDAKKKKKKKKKKDKVKDRDTSKKGDTNTMDVGHVDDTPKKKKKDAVTIEVEQQVSGTKANESKKKKKQKHTENIENMPPTIDEHTDRLEGMSDHSTKKDDSSTRKKKNKKLKHDDDKYEVITIDDSVENQKEVSDKENTHTEEDNKTQSKKKKSKKGKTKSVDNKVAEVSSICSVDEPKERTEGGIQETVESATVDISLEAKVTRSPWNQRARMSKKLLVSLFHRNAISNFPGSNIYDIEGYAANIS